MSELRKIKELKISKKNDSCPIVSPKPIPEFTYDTSRIEVHKDFFKFWCQKIQPLVYDDSLSYYEVLRKVAWELNEVIEKLNTLSDEQKAFVEKVVSLVNQLISEWNKLVEWWECVINQWESMVDQFNKWENKFDRWEQEFNEWKAEFENWRNEFNELKKEWNDFRTEINNKLEEFENKLGDTIINLNSVPIVKSSRINFNVPESETNELTLDIRDLIYPEVTLRFMSLIGGIDNLTFNTVGVQGGIKVYNLSVKNITTDDPNFPWMGEQLSNPAIGAGTIFINGTLYPCVMPTIPVKPNNQSNFDLVIPKGYGINESQRIEGKYYVYEGGKTILYKTTENFFGNNR